MSDLHKGEFHHAISVGLRFQQKDAPILRGLAARLRALPSLNHRENAEAKLFEEAAKSAENETLMVFQCGLDEQLQEVLDCFPQFGIKRPTVEVLRIPSPVRGGRPVRL